MKILCFEIKYVGWNIFRLSNQHIKNKVLNVWIENDSKIWAVKEHRRLTGSGLKEAKYFCDALQEEYYRIKEN